MPACCATLRTLAQANRVIAANQVGLLKALFKQLAGSLLLRHTGIQFAAIHSLLESVPRQHCEWVFANPKTLKPYVSIFCSWNTARTKAGLADVRIHDLRHSYASFLVNAGRSLYEVQRLLGHTQIKTTQRYAHLSHDTLLDATNSVNTTLAGMFVPMVSAQLAA